MALVRMGLIASLLAAAPSHNRTSGKPKYITPPPVSPYQCLETHPQDGWANSDIRPLADAIAFPRDHVIEVLPDEQYKAIKMLETEPVRKLDRLSAKMLTGKEYFGDQTNLIPYLVRTVVPHLERSEVYLSPDTLLFKYAALGCPYFPLKPFVAFVPHAIHSVRTDSGFAL